MDSDTPQVIRGHRYCYHAAEASTPKEYARPRPIPPSLLHIYMLIEQRHQFFDFPNLVRDARFHLRCDAERLVDAAEVVLHVVQGEIVSEVLSLLAERIR